jgi:7-cyano-7-deazaguanine reductase
MKELMMNNIDYGALGSGNSYAVYSDTFDSSLLNPLPRAELRKRFGIRGDEFVGYDVWHCHESTFLLNSGSPVAGTLKFHYPASSPNMVESKSMKLYLNSFDMCKMGDTLDDAIDNYVNQIKNDLSSIVGSEVEAKFFDSISWWLDSSHMPIIGSDCTNIFELYDFDEVEIDDYDANQSYIQLIDRDQTIGVDGCYYTNVLRSRCRHTKQKDTGSAYLWHDTRFRGGQVIDPLSFFRQVVSLREVNEFHELCAEKLFFDCYKMVGKGDELTIALLYSRRGSLDINPVRSTDINQIPYELIDVSQLTSKTQGQ